MPSQNALMLPATNPERIFSEAPPSREDDTTSRTWIDSMDVNTFTNSGMIAPASVPQLITQDSFHQREESPPRSGTIAYETMYVPAIETSDVIQTRLVSGASKFILSALPYRRLAIAAFSQ